MVLFPRIFSIAAQANLQPSLFLLAPTYREQSNEHSHLATFRAQLLGGRRVVYCKIEHVVAYVESLGIKPTMKDVCAFMKELNVDQAKEFQLKCGPIYHAIVNAGDVLFVPPGWVTNEGVIGKNPCVGVRLQSLSASDFVDIETLETIFREKFQKPNERLVMIKDYILLA